MLEISELVLGRITQAGETISLLFHYQPLWVDMAEDEQPPMVARLLMTLTTQDGDLQTFYLKKWMQKSCLECFLLTVSKRIEYGMLS